MPGVPSLSKELEVDPKAVDAALRLLEDEGLLVGQGVGRKRRIELPAGHVPSSLRVAILDYEPRHEAEGYKTELYHLLIEAGHAPFITSKCLTALKMDVTRVARMVKQTPADAWVVTSASREVLAWFVEQDIPVFSLYGRHASFPIAAVAPDKNPVIATTTRRLIELGHRRISLLCHRQHRLPHPGVAARIYLDVFETAGLEVSDFNLPDWEPSKEGLAAQLDSMFRYTPPTALILDEAFLFTSVSTSITPSCW